MFYCFSFYIKTNTLHFCNIKHYNFGHVPILTISIITLLLSKNTRILPLYNCSIHHTISELYVNRFRGGSSNFGTLNYYTVRENFTDDVNNSLNNSLIYFNSFTEYLRLQLVIQAKFYDNKRANLTFDYNISSSERFKFALFC